MLLTRCVDLQFCSLRLWSACPVGLNPCNHWGIHLHVLQFILQKSRLDGVEGTYEVTEHDLHHTWLCPGRSKPSAICILLHHPHSHAGTNAELTSGVCVCVI